MSSAPTTEVNALSSSDESAVMGRLSGLYDRAAGDLADTIVLFGAGNLGRRTLRLLRSLGIEPLAFGDNNPELWGRKLDGLTVHSASDVVTRWGGKAAIVVTVFRGAAARRHLESLGCPLVVPYMHLYWRHREVMTPYPGLFHPSETQAGGESVRRAHSLWSDERSARLYAALIDWRLSFDLSVLPQPSPEDQIYRPPEVVPMDDEVFVDCGAFDGDTLQEFVAKREGRFARYYALEPDPANYKALQARIGRMGPDVETRTTPLNVAAAGRSGLLRFDASGTVASSLNQEGSATVPCLPLDDVLAGEHPTFLKLDVEGAELDALRGAADTIRRCRPVLAVCLYHKPEDLWTIPLYVDSLGGDYVNLLRAHAEEGWELVYYAVPPERYQT